MSATPVPAPARNRQLALGMLALVVLAVVTLVALPTWYLYHRYDSTLTDWQNKAERFSRIAATRADVARQLEAMRGKDTRKMFLRSGAAALSAAEAQEYVRDMVASAGGRLITMQALPAKEEGRYRQATAQVQLSANVY